MKWLPEHQEAVLKVYENSGGKLPGENSKEVQSLAKDFGVGPDTIGFKLANFRFLDPAEEAKGKKGFQGVSKSDVEVWLGGGHELSKRALLRVQEKGWSAELGVSGTVLTSIDGVEDKAQRNFYLSLLAKPFTILTGASGTGKTKVAESLTKALANEDESNSAVVAVGSDWTDNRNVLGFVNHLREGKDNLPIYQTTPILDLLLKASEKENKDLPYFLILDEMNLSHVERYFADFLSAMERSAGELALHQEGDEGTLLQRSPKQEGDVPQSLPYPQNLFVIGTVNIDETTYMFSPKVLDRANVIEFAVDSGDIESFLAEPKDYEMAEKASAGKAEGFLALSKQARQLKEGLDGLPEESKEKADAHLVALFDILKSHRYEYGYRTAAEVTKYLRVCRHLADDKAKWDSDGWQGSLDEQIVQKLLPKLHGSVGRIGTLLAGLGYYCHDGSEKKKARLDELLTLEMEKALFPKSFAKLKSMAQTLRDEQFVSFIQ